MIITSIHNQKILALRKLFKSSERKNSDVFIAEGKKEVTRGILSAYEIIGLYYSSAIIAQESLDSLLTLVHNNTEVFDIDKTVYEKLAYRDNTEGIIAVFKKKIFTLNDFLIGGDDIYLILEAIEKPGNLGAILRSADAAGIKGIILTQSKVDQFNPNVIRSSLGTVFRIPVVITSNEDVCDWLKKNNIKSFSAALPSFKDLYDLDLKGNIAMIFGSESSGLSEFWVKRSDEVYTIPMRGIVDSLNVSVSAAISVYEALRQRKYQS
jgi:TrmH family RNA methyltransferase